VLLDEAMGMAITAGSEEEAYVVTVEFKLRYRRPVPVGVPLVVRGDLRRREGRDAWVEGAIVDTRGVRLTVAEARWRQIDPPEEAA
jgi:acyl-coenzyme A thioesterase PaaI-like protein